jgi:hypothetical protein
MFSAAMRFLQLIALVVLMEESKALSLSPSTHSKGHRQSIEQMPISSSPMSRRSCLRTAAGGLLMGTVVLTGDDKSDVVWAEDTIQSVGLGEYRSRLLQLIQSPSASETEVLNVISKLTPLDPSKQAAATMKDDLDGEWKLLWSAKAEAFSPLLKLPKPLKPNSFQYLGQAAETEVGADRVAQGLTGGVLGNSQLWLSSSVKTSPDDPSVLEIFPPFRLEVGGRYQSGKVKNLLVEAGSDAEFRKLNARTSEAQAAPKNRYQQLYLERNGKGSLRISTITEGDPVIVGAVFVHEKL